MTNEEAREQIDNLRAHCSDMARSTFTGGEVLWAKDVEALDQAIKALAQEPKTGHWIRFKEFENGYYHIKCSECGQYWSIDGHAKIFRYCFNCGAKMGEVEE